MGNILCKNRVNHSNNSKSPVDRVIGRCAQICPKSLGKQKHFWDKQVLETSPPHQTQPTPDNSGWSSASLTVPDSPQPNGEIDQPVAPPRKKRPSMLRKDDPPIRNGFKEIFAGNRSESTTTSDSQGDAKDFTDFEKVPLNRGSEKEKEKMEKIEKVDKLAESTRSSEERSDQSESKTCSLTHKVPKVGNKKTDKFFGENLSDCLSDEPMVHSDDDEVAKINEAVIKSQEISQTSEAIVRPEEITKIDEAILKPEDIAKIDDAIIRPGSKTHKYDEIEDAIKEDLLASLTILKDLPKEESYDEPDRVAVEEPIITKVIVTRHVCDDDDQLRMLLHDETDHAYVVPDPNAPKKPQRDFSKYKKQNESAPHAQGSNSSEIESNETDSALDLLSQIQKELPPSINILSPKAKDIKNLGEVTSASHAPEVLRSDAKTVKDEVSPPKEVESLSKQMSQSEETLRSQLSTQSYLTPDLVEQITQQVKLSENYFPDDYNSHKDGSEVAPVSKLVHKRSLGSQTVYVNNGQKNQSSEVKPSSEDARKLATLTIQTIEIKAPETLEEPTAQSTQAKEPETPPVFYKLTASSLIPKKENELIQETSNEVSTSKKRNPHQVPTKMQISNEDTNKNISKAINTFLEKEYLNPEEVLTLLEDEFGDLLDVTSLSQEDQKLLQDLRNAANAKDFKVHDLDSNILEDISITHALQSPDFTISHSLEPDSDLLESPKLILQVENEDTFKDNDETDRESNASNITVVPSDMSRTVMDDKRRHSIDEFDHWFAGGLSKKVEVPQRKRKREFSLPGYLSSDSSVDEIAAHVGRHHAHNAYKDQGAPDDDQFQNKEHATVISTTGIHIFDTIPESVQSVPSELEKAVSEITIIPLNSTESEISKTNESNETENVTIGVRKQYPSQKIVRGENNRTSVGHSLLLKFLNVERSNSFK